MPDFKNRSRTNGSYSRSSIKNSFGPKELFDAECNSCHKRTRIPFRPNGKRPVYCSDCFKKNDSRRPSRDPSGTHTFSYHTDIRGRSDRSDSSESFGRQLKELKAEVRIMNATLEHLVTAVDTFNRATALTLEIQKHFSPMVPVKEKKTAAKKVATKPTKASAKK